LEADLAGGGPGDDGAGRVRDGHDGVVERALDVGLAVDDVLLVLAARLARGGLTGLGCHAAELLWWMGGWPEASGARSACGAGADRGPTACAADQRVFFLPATVRFGPLGARSWVFVR